MATTERTIWVAGFPGFWGGADTELDHLVDLFRARGVETHFVPMFFADPCMVDRVRQRGGRIHDYSVDIFRDKTVISFCNRNFMDHLPHIAARGRPRKVIWFNCMSWLVDSEIYAHRLGLIDYFGFLSRYQERILTPLLSAIAPFRTFPHKPYFNASRIEWQYRRWDGEFRLGRISRDDWSKYAPDTWQIFADVEVPHHLQKRVYVLGYGPNARRAIGAPPKHLDARTWPCNGIPTTDFYRTIDIMIHKVGTSRESYCRVLIEAYAHGVVPIVENDYAFPELAIDGETAFMTSDSREMSERATELAHDPKKHRRMAENGRAHLVSVINSAENSWRGWEFVLDA
jgi:glycosyltransferase involved in cell wall biosynthesis